MNKSETTTPATSVVESVSSSARTTTASTGTTTTSVKIARQRGTSASNSSPLTETTMTTNFPFIGSAVLHLNGYHHGELLDRLNVVARHDPEWIRNIADIMMTFDWESEEEKKVMLKWSINEKYVTAVNS